MYKIIFFLLFVSSRLLSMDVSINDLEHQFAEIFHTKNDSGVRFIDHGPLWEKFIEQCDEEETKRVLFIGCADCKRPYEIHKRFPNIEVFANEISHENTKEIRAYKKRFRKRTKNLKIIHGDAVNLLSNNTFLQANNFKPQNSFDAIYIANVFHFLSPKKILFILNMVHQLLRNSGRLYVQTHVLSPGISKKTWDNLQEGMLSFSDFNTETGMCRFVLDYTYAITMANCGCAYPGYISPEMIEKNEVLKGEWHSIDYEKFIATTSLLGFDCQWQKSFNRRANRIIKKESFTKIGTQASFIFVKAAELTEDVFIELIDEAEKDLQIHHNFCSSNKFILHQEERQERVVQMMIDELGRICLRHGFEIYTEYLPPFMSAVKRSTIVYE